MSRQGAGLWGHRGGEDREADHVPVNQLLDLGRLEKAMATHSSVLAWRIPGTGQPGGLLSMGSHRVRHDCSDLAAAALKYINYHV